MVGLVLININPAYRTTEVEYALNKVDCKVLVVGVPDAKFSEELCAWIVVKPGRRRRALQA